MIHTRWEYENKDEPRDSRKQDPLTFSSLSSRKSSCGDLQSRLKVRKVLGVGDASGSTASSKISQILGQSDHLIFQLPPNLATWLIVTTALFSCFTLTVGQMNTLRRGVIFIRRDSCGHPVYFWSYPVVWNRRFTWQPPMRVGERARWSERLISIEILVLTAILALTLRSGDKTSLQSVLFSLVCFHGLSLFSKSFRVSSASVDNNHPYFFSCTMAAENKRHTNQIDTCDDSSL